MQDVNPDGVSALAERRASALLEGLNEPQLEAVTCTDGPLLVLAAAGSGKTRVITRRAAYLARTVAESRQVLAITFTNKAAGEMKQRIADLGIGPQMTVCTFHALGARLLRWFAAEADVDPNFTILDQGEQRQLVAKAIAGLQLSSANWSPAVVQARISEAKNNLLTADPETLEPESGGFAERQIARVHQAYEQLLRRHRALDFDDLLLKPALLLGRRQDIRDALEDRFRYVLIDEYQDTNRAQYLLARGLTLRHENICATGDPDQAIYAWRGADIRNILEFEHDFPRARVVRLEQNYRSTGRILKAAGTLIRANRRRKDKQLWTENAPGARVRVVQLEDAANEADYVVGEIGAYRDSGGSLNDAAVFYRVNSLTRGLEEALLRAGIGYQVARGTEFYNRKEIKDLLAYLRVLVNPADEPAFVRSVSTPSRGVGKTSMQRLLNHAAAHGLTALEAARRAAQIPELKRTASAVRGFAALFDGWHSRIDDPLPELVEAIFVESGLEAELKKQDTVGEDAVQNVGELISAAADFAMQHPQAPLAEWLQQISLVSDVDTVSDTAGKVTLMTLHAAKGLEFPKVFIIGVEEGLLPHANYKEQPEQLEEERRLCFVGITRAQRELTLTYAKWRQHRGLTIRATQSAFLSELAVEDIDWQRLPDEAPSGRASDLRPEAGDYRGWKKGMYLRHPSFGVGQLLWTQAGGNCTRAGVRFPAFGEKTLILEYAKLRPLDPDECQL